MSAYYVNQLEQSALSAHKYWYGLDSTDEQICVVNGQFLGGRLNLTSADVAARNLAVIYNIMLLYWPCADVNIMWMA